MRHSILEDTNTAYDVGLNAGVQAGVPEATGVYSSRALGRRNELDRSPALRVLRPSGEIRLIRSPRLENNQRENEMRTMLTVLTIVVVICLLAHASAAGTAIERHTLMAVPFTDVRLTDEFWAPRIETNRRTTVRYCFDKCDETGRLSNFAKAGGLIEGEFEGIYFNDSDVYKVIEGAAYVLAAHEDPELDAFLDELIETIAAAQEDDGYLNTYYTLVAPDKKWTHLAQMHELYCAGHLFEAAVAHYQATGKKTLLDVATRFADLIDSIFGPNKRHDVPGHEEIEIGLVKLYRATGEERYLNLAKFFIDERGRSEHRELYGPYCQDHVPVVDQDTPVGHAVRAMYLYCGMADVAALLNVEPYIAALDRIWNDQTEHKLYITGGVGARHAGEAFGDRFELPNDTAYCETCAAIGNALWNHRMNLLHGNGKYADVLERVIYNGFLSGVSLSGDRFFYVNPLASHGNQHRSEWFNCSCCPVNVVRFIPSIPGYIYAFDNTSNVYVNLYIGSESTIHMPDRNVQISQQTKYPWDGRVELVIDPEKDNETFEVCVRVPGWVAGSPLPGGLYSYSDSQVQPCEINVNDQYTNAKFIDGYARINRAWRKGDVITLNWPMPARLVETRSEVKANVGRSALLRGPIVYCVESVDVGGPARHFYLPDNPAFKITHEPELLGGVTTISAQGRMQVEINDRGKTEDRELPFKAIPYYAWDHRESGDMAVWLPRNADVAGVVPLPTIASQARVTASHCWSQDGVEALNDLIKPKSSIDHDVPRMTWWNHKGTTEWVQYDFESPVKISTTSVYWFDDTTRGECRIPASWRVLYRDQSGAWIPVTGATMPEVVADAFNSVEFDAVSTDALRLEVKLRQGFSGGILEWTVE
jgi:DUF1680 family protein